MLSLPPMRVVAAAPASRRLPPAPAPKPCQAIRPKACKPWHRSDALGKTTPAALATARRRPVSSARKTMCGPVRNPQLASTQHGNINAACQQALPTGTPSRHHAAALGGEVVPIAFAGARRLELVQLACHLFVLLPGGIEFGAQIGDRIEQVPAPQRGGLGKR